MDIGKHLKEFRQEKGVSRESLSSILGISIHALAKYEQNQREPNIETLNKIAKALDTTLDKLLHLGTNNIDLSQLSTSKLIEELNSREDFPIKIAMK
jgi:transcriptional regulator with XRE-family HTH domain